MARASSGRRRFALPALDPKTGLTNAVIEAPRGSPYKYKFDPESGEFLLDKALPIGAVFPFDFGFVPSTQAADGDPLDILLLLDQPAQLGSIVPARVIGVIEAEQTNASGETERNDRLLAVLETRHNPPRFNSLGDLNEQMLAEIEHFFKSYNEMEGRTFKVIGRGSSQKAKQLIAQNSTRRRRASPTKQKPTRRTGK
jgi:inorganic pyrophosphatase